MPGELDTNCKELRLKKMSVEAFKREVENLRVKIGNANFTAYDHTSYRSAVFEGDEGREYFERRSQEQRESFWNDHKKEFVRGLEALKQGPKGRDPESMLKWVKQFPYVVACPKLLEDHGYGDPLKEKYYDLGRTWRELFSGDKAVETIYGEQTGYGYDVYERKSNLNDFQKEADKIFGPVRGLNEEEIELDRLVGKLENASMFTDSGEYRNLISMTKMLNETEIVPHTEGLTQKQNQAMKLAMIKTCVDTYLDHKAKDGVKRNVYHKLAAVEELNRYICKRMEDVGVWNIPDQKMHDELFFPKTVEDESSILEIKHPQTYSTEEIEANVEKANQADSGNSTTVDECARTLDCMARILMRAEHLKVPDTQIQELTAVREQFFRNPGRGPETAIDEIAEDNPMKDLPQAY